MKKITLILILSAAFSQLKAQQAITVQPVAPLTNGLTNIFKPETSAAPNQLLVQHQTNSIINIAGINIVNAVVYSNMLIVHARSNDRMPIAKLQDNEHDRMPLLKITVMRPGDQVQTPAP